MTSGGFDPIHPGHVSLFAAARSLGDILVVVVNGDNFLIAKKGKPFQDLKTRTLIISGLRNVDFVIPFEIEKDITVAKALEFVRPHIFANGGDRSSGKRLPEQEVSASQRYGIKFVFKVGMSKKWSSSWFLQDWENFKKRASIVV